jgi:deoxyribonuclease V
MTSNGAERGKEDAGRFFAAADTGDARRIQQELRGHSDLRRTIETGTVRLIAGADAAYSQDLVHAAVVVQTFPDLKTVDSACAARTITFPYIPGFLFFREGPAIIEAFGQLTTIPDVIFLNGHGYAHPERFGLASHIGIALDIPSVGVAQRLLSGTAKEPGNKRGSVAPVTDDGEVIGMAVRTKAGSKPVFVSAGHKVDLEQAVDLVLCATTSHRFPEPLYYADRLSGQCKRTSEITPV